MPRYRIKVEYDGQPFVGWQRQDNGPGVQGVLEEAVKAFSHEQVTVFGAGRTDAGVHALGQVAHFDLDQWFPTDTIRDAMNAHLRPNPVAVLDAEEVSEEFHARFSATSRTYLYRIVNRRPPLTITAGKAWWVPTPLDVTAMHEAARVLVGRHDFSSFRSTFCQAKSPVKTLDHLDVVTHDGEIHFHAHAKSFLHNQVRIMVGSLRYVGEGKWSPDDLKEVLEACDRTRAGQTAVPDGLYLTAVGY